MYTTSIAIPKAWIRTTGISTRVRSEVKRRGVKLIIHTRTMQLAAVIRRFAPRSPIPLTKPCTPQEAIK